jgi:serine/threonine protein kinase
MTLSTGTTLSHYEITSQIGKGGMGEVYQAKDQKLGRDVAIKVLPQEFAQDADRVTRFQREAKLLASLNHPNIAAIYGLEESDGTNFLVMELVEGQTLDARIKSGAIPVEEALKLALQIAEALEAAHEKGVIHRDLKPANIKVTPEGKVKVLDFGLAKALAGEKADLNLSNSPTLSQAATMQGVILGTAAYMSPEQARGKPVDKRTDVWAFGCVLYEMLTGQAAFQGEDVTEILAAVVKSDVNLDLLPATIHSRIHEVLLRCLKKDIKKRYRDIGDLQYDLDLILSDPKGLILPKESIPYRKDFRKILFPWLMFSLAVVCIAILLVVFLKNRSIEPIAIRSAIPLLNEQILETDTPSPLLSLSPDGSKLVYVGTEGGKKRLFIRYMNREEPEPIPGTEGAYCPFFSYDGKSVGFFSGVYLKTVNLTGGDPLKLSVVPPVTRGASWGDDDTIVVTSDPNGPLLRFTSSGKPLEDVTKIDQGHGLSHRWPEFLPGGRAILYTRDMGEQLGEASIEIVSLDTGKSTQLIPGATFPRYVKTGYIVYARAGSLFAVPFDIESLKVTGDPFPVVKKVLLEPDGAAQFDVSDNGTLIYISGGLQESLRRIVRIDRKGNVKPLSLAPDRYQEPSLSPNGQRVAVTINKGANSDIYWGEVDAGRLQRLTADPNEDVTPLWTPDGLKIVFGSEMSGTAPQLHWVSLDDSANPEIIIKHEEGSRSDIPGSFSSDGKNLAFTSIDSRPLGSEGLDKWTAFDVFIASLNDSKWSYKSFADSHFSEGSPSFSHDNRWIAFVSDEDGTEQVYVQSFVNQGEKKLVSIDGGIEPVFNSNGREIFFRDDDKLMSRAVDITGSEVTFLDLPEKLFKIQSWYIDDLGPIGRNYAVFDDGQHFLVIQSPNDSSVNRINIVTNWFEELKQKMPVP